jgi:hypothetical protein
MPQYDWSKAKRLSSTQMIRECTVIALSEAVLKGRVTDEAMIWITQRIDALLDALIQGKALAISEDGTYVTLDRPEGFDPDHNPEVLVIKPKGSKQEKKA